MLGLNFFRPVVFYRNVLPEENSDLVASREKKSVIKASAEFIDSYFQPLFATVSLVIRSAPSSYYHIEVPSKRSSKWIAVAKVASYFLVFPIIIALILKLIFRIIISKQYGAIPKKDPNNLLLGFSKSEMQDIREENYKILLLAEKYQGKIPEEDLDNLGLKIIQQLKGISYTSVKFPGYIFKSCKFDQAMRRYVASIIGSSFVQTYDLDLLYVPKILFEKSLVPGESILIEENLPLKLVKESHIKYRPEKEVKYYAEPGVELNPALEQLIVFVSKTLYPLLSWEYMPILESGDGKSPKIVLTTLNSIVSSELSSRWIWSQSTENLENLIKAWITKDWTLPNGYNPLAFLDNALYQACPREEIRALLDETKNGLR